jgi:hypothetical protein
MPSVRPGPRGLHPIEVSSGSFLPAKNIAAGNGARSRQTIRIES